MISRLPGLSLPERAWGVVRRWALAWWRILYLGAVVCVLVLSPSSYGKVTRRALARHLYLDTAPVLAQLQALQAAAPDSLVYEGPNRAAPTQAQRFHAPTTLAELAALREALPQARLLAGATDIGLWVNKQCRDLGEIIYVGKVAEFQGVTLSSGPQPVLEIGAGASLEAAWSALAQHVPALKEIWLRFASPPVRHAGTMGGNVANGSPIGDSAPVLIALGASIQLRRGATTRTMPLEDFYLDYMKNQLQPGELVTGLHVPLPTPAQQLRAYKISKRFDCDISALFAALSLELDGGVVRSARWRSGTMLTVAA